MNLSCLLCYQASPTPVCHWCDDDMFFFDTQIHGDDLLRYGPVGRHVKHSHYKVLSVLGLHTWPMSSLVHQFKFTHSLTAGKVLSNWFVHKKRHCTLAVPNLLLPVPISAWRLAHRHYNQAAVICHYLSNALSIPFDNNWAKRHGSSVQHHLSKAKRADNARQTYRLTQRAIDKWYPIQQCNDKVPFTVAIVDDVITTGVTVNTLAKLLKDRYPAIHVQVWALTFTPPPKSVLLKLE
ncbi:ComF family protein [Alteromonas sp. McT4-15]|uniref:ComF family protein n=1 Tax=Alteromonas sp. McT4-15 TaxID=2881256 RepID=UPI0013590677|nr:ComF family protein [Alteromonas sp. McT4-15]MCB4434649.1 ComF family protein [Alteromonas sp. McT4-15]MEC8230436.1 ComF family protein [Pseudomonadota bacterium]